MNIKFMIESKNEVKKRKVDFHSASVVTET